MNLDSLLSLSPVIPVVTIEDAGRAVPLARALLEGGVPVIEVTLRSGAALKSIERISAQVSGMTVLAGTVCTGEQVRDSLQAGARGLVSPGITDRLAGAVQAYGATWLPGVASASDIMLGLELGLSRFKLFPASVVGGAEALGAYAGPFPKVRFCPTGGIGRDAAARYLSLGNVICVGGSWLAPGSLVAAQDWTQIRANAAFAAGLPRASH